MIHNMMQWIINNISVIKDFLWIVFTCIATIIAIFTYRRARFTLLQPLRTEVIKRQTDIFIELLEFLEDDSHDLFNKIDYTGIIYSNVYKQLNELGYVFKDDLYNGIEENLAGMRIVSKNEILKTVKLPEVFEDVIEEKENWEKLKRERYELAKSGTVNIECIFLTRQYMQTIQLLDTFINNPFMPKEIVPLLKKINEDVIYNVSNPLTEELEKALLSFCTNPNQPNEINSVNINPSAIYNLFQRRAIHHNRQIEKVRELTRQYLLIDYKWK